MSPRQEIDRQNKGFISAMYSVCSCMDSYEFNISAVNRCGHTGASTPTITLGPPTPLDTLECDSNQMTERTITIGDKVIYD